MAGAGADDDGDDTVYHDAAETHTDDATNTTLPASDVFALNAKQQQQQKDNGKAFEGTALRAECLQYYQSRLEESSLMMKDKLRQFMDTPWATSSCSSYYSICAEDKDVRIARFELDIAQPSQEWLKQMLQSELALSIGNATSAPTTAVPGFDAEILPTGERSNFMPAPEPAADLCGSKGDASRENKDFASLETEFLEHAKSIFGSLQQSISEGECFCDLLWTNAVNFVDAIRQMDNDILSSAHGYHFLQQFCSDVGSMLAEHIRQSRLDLKRCSMFLRQSCDGSVANRSTDASCASVPDVLQKGDVVELYGMNKASMNGEQGTIVGEEHKGRFRVELVSGGKPVSIKATNLASASRDPALQNLPTVEELVGEPSFTMISDADIRRCVAPMMKCVGKMQKLITASPYPDVSVRRTEFDEYFNKAPRTIIDEWCGLGGELLTHYERLTQSSEMTIDQLQNNLAVTAKLRHCDNWLESPGLERPFTNLEVALNKQKGTREMDEERAVEFVLGDFNLDALEQYKGKQLEASTLDKIRKRTSDEAKMLQERSQTPPGNETDDMKQLFRQFNYLWSRTSQIEWCVDSKVVKGCLLVCQKALADILGALLNEAQTHLDRHDFDLAEKRFKFVNDGLLFPHDHQNPSATQPFPEAVALAQQFRRSVEVQLTCTDGHDYMLDIYCSPCQFVLLQNPTTEHLKSVVEKRDGVLVFVASDIGAPVGTNGAPSTYNQKAAAGFSIVRMHDDLCPPTECTHDGWIALRDHLHAAKQSPSSQSQSAYKIAQCMNTIQDNYRTQQFVLLKKKALEVAEIFALPGGFMKTKKGNLGNCIETLKKSGQCPMRITDCLHRLKKPPTAFKVRTQCHRAYIVQVG